VVNHYLCVAVSKRNSFFSSRVLCIPLQAYVVDRALCAVNGSVPRLPVLLEHLRDKVQLVLVEIVLSVCLDDILCWVKTSLVEFPF